MRKRIFEIIELPKDGDRVGTFYSIFMMCAIVISIIPLTLKGDYRFFYYSDIITTGVFILDYALRLITADYKLQKKGLSSFIRYPFTPLAIVDLISILPGVIMLNRGLKLLRLIRIVRTLRVFRVFKTLRYSKSIAVIINVIRKSRDSLIAVCVLALGYILISALVVFNVEGDSFETFFEAVYWATVSLTTVGYGDIYPVTTAGRIITMISSFFGIAIVALPAGIITAGFMDELNNAESKKE